MIHKVNDCQKVHDDLVYRLRSKVKFEQHITDRMILMAFLKNFRKGGGLRLTDYGFSVSTELGLYEFCSLKVKEDLREASFLYTSLDRVCESPYYVHTGKGIVYFSDQQVFALLTLVNDDFKKLFENFL